MKKSLFIPLLSFFIPAFFGCGNKVAEIQISAPLRPKYIAQGYKRLYIADFVVGGEHDVDTHVNINVNKEIKETLKSEFKDKSGYQIEDLKLQLDKTAKAQEVFKDPEFWKAQQIPVREASMVLAGIVDFSNREKSGLVTERVTNPRTGLQRDLTTSRDRLQLILNVTLFLVDASSGQKLFQENFKEEEVYDDVSNVSLPLFYDVFERMTPKIVGILVPYRVAGSRTLMEP
jgi:hypothetical protein